MVYDEVSVYNMALDACGARNNILNPMEDSREAETCRMWFGPIRDSVMRAAYWNCCKAWERLALLKERQNEIWTPTDPEPGFRFQYSAPHDMLIPRWMSDYSRFTMGVQDEVVALNSNSPDAVLCFTKREENIRLWDSNLALAIVYGLAAYISMPINGKPLRANLNMQQANQLIFEAQAVDMNAEEAQLDSIPDWIRARGYNFNQIETRYVYPLGPMISLGALGVGTT